MQGLLGLFTGLVGGCTGISSIVIPEALCMFYNMHVLTVEFQKVNMELGAVREGVRNRG